MKGVWSILTRKIGAVRVDISQPFSLQVSGCHGNLCCHEPL